MKWQEQTAYNVHEIDEQAYGVEYLACWRFGIAWRGKENGSDEALYEQNKQQKVGVKMDGFSYF